LFALLRFDPPKFCAAADICTDWQQWWGCKTPGWKHRRLSHVMECGRS
jgi:hypothetical protein